MGTGGVALDDIEVRMKEGGGGEGGKVIASPHSLISVRTEPPFFVIFQYTA